MRIHVERSSCLCQIVYGWRAAGFIDMDVAGGGAGVEVGLGLEWSGVEVIAEMEVWGIPHGIFAIYLRPPSTYPHT